MVLRDQEILSIQSLQDHQMVLGGLPDQEAQTAPLVLMVLRNRAVLEDQTGLAVPAVLKVLRDLRDQECLT